MSIITDALRKAEQERVVKIQEAAQKEITREETPASAIPQAPQMLETFQEESIAAFKNRARTYDSKFSRNPVFNSTNAASAVIIGTTVVLFLVYRFIVTEPVGTSFQPIEQSSVQLLTGSYQLSGISSTGGERYAIINGSIVQKGDSVGRAKVKDILEREVVLKTRSGETRLTLVS